MVASSGEVPPAAGIVAAARGGRGAIAVLGALTRSPLQQWLRVGGTPAHPAEANTHNTRRREIPAGFRPRHRLKAKIMIS